MPFFKPFKTGFLIRVHAQPGSARNQITGLHGEALKIKIKAQPEDGKANAALEEFLAEKLAVAKSCVQIVKGHRSRAKEFYISGVSEEALRRLALF